MFIASDPTSLRAGLEAREPEILLESAELEKAVFKFKNLGVTTALALIPLALVTPFTGPVGAAVGIAAMTAMVGRDVMRVVGTLGREPAMLLFFSYKRVNAEGSDPKKELLRLSL